MATPVRSAKGMFNISTKVQYGFLALLALSEGASAAHGAAGGTPHEPVPLASIASSLHLSFKYLENIFTLLSRGGIVRGRRGPEGGYVLKRPPRELKLFDIFRALEGTVFTVECFDQSSACNHLALCPVRDLWGELRGTLENFLKRRTLHDIRRKYKKSAVLAHMRMPDRTAAQRGKKAI